jgi:hypothetical protein
MVVRRPIDCLAILTASVASIVIIINAVFLQSDFRHGTDQPRRASPQASDAARIFEVRGGAPAA